MSELSISELKRLTPPFANKTDEENAAHYWAARSPAEKMQATARLIREFCLWRGIDIGKAMDKTPRRTTWEEENREHEEWHSAYELFHASR